MKLKEKLASELVSEMFKFCSPYSPLEHKAFKAYTIGFAKASEIASDRLKTSVENPRYKGQLFSKALELIADDIKNMGEEQLSD